MLMNICRKLFILFLFLTHLVLSAQDIKEIRENFLNPPDSAKPFTWWHWMNGNISKDGIVKDLEAMKNAGLGGFHLFNVAPKDTAKGKINWGSKEWFDALELAAKKAEELGLDFTYHNSGGFATTASAYLDPKFAMKQLIWTTTRAVGGDSIIKLKDFDFENSESPLIYTINASQPEPHPKKLELMKGFCVEVAVIAFPTPANERSSGQLPARLDNWEVKAGFGKRTAHYTVVFPTEDKLDGKEAIKFSEIIDLTDNLGEGGVLKWTAPLGKDWTILRFAYTLTGMQNHPAPDGSRGLECDKFSKEAVNSLYKKGVKPIIDSVNTGGKVPIRAVLIDSYEAREQNWTTSMISEFFNRRSYEIYKYMPAFTGRIIENNGFTERFLFDVRRTFADMIAENHYAEFAKLCHEDGLKFALEPYGFPSPIDSMQSGRSADILMGEFWARRTAGKSDLSVRLAASIADLKGSRIVGAEAFTGGKAFEDTPESFKKQGDFYFTQGMNRAIFHTFAHQPFADSIKPGMSMWQWGSQIHRNNTWWNQASGWFKYLARAQYLLQQGKRVTDIAMYYGSNTPAIPITQTPDIDEKIRRSNFIPIQLYPEGFPKVPNGHDYHFIDTSFLKEFVAKDGFVVHKPSGYKYSLIVIKDDERIDIDIFNHILRLVKDGANIMMNRPISASGLKDYPSIDGAVQYMADALFAKQLDDHFVYGTGRVFPHSMGIEKALEIIKISKDFSFTDVSGKSSDLVFYIHKVLSNAEFYFITNLGDEKMTGDYTFRTSANKAIEIWDAESAEISYATCIISSTDSSTKIRYSLEAGESKFFVFRKDDAALAQDWYIKGVDKAVENFSDGKNTYLKSYVADTYICTDNAEKTHSVKFDNIPAEIDLSAGWKLSFPKEKGLRQGIDLQTLTSWHTLQAFDEKHFSGTATYEKTFSISEEYLMKNSGVTLDLGAVSDIAEVFVNGKKVSTLWKHPFKVDITKFLKAGENILRVDVTNTFTNRLIGDAELPDDCPERDKAYPDWLFDSSIPRPNTGRKLFCTYNYSMKGKPPLPAGMLGPVRLSPYSIKPVLADSFGE